MSASRKILVEMTSTELEQYEEYKAIKEEEQRQKNKIFAETPRYNKDEWERFNKLSPQEQRYESDTRR